MHTYLFIPSIALNDPGNRLCAATGQATLKTSCILFLYHLHLLKNFVLWGICSYFTILDHQLLTTWASTFSSMAMRAWASRVPALGAQQRRSDPQHNCTPPQSAANKQVFKCAVLAMKANLTRLLHRHTTSGRQLQTYATWCLQYSCMPHPSFSNCSPHCSRCMCSCSRACFWT